MVKYVGKGPEDMDGTPELQVPNVTTLLCGARFYVLLQAIDQHLHIPQALPKLPQARRHTHQIWV